MMAAFRRHLDEATPERITVSRKRSHERLVLAEVVGYYGLLAAAAITTIFLH